MQWCCQIFFTDCIFTGRWHSAVYLVSEQPEPAPLNSIERIYRGDIDTIVAKALEKDKERRYMSAAELAADIRRYLADEPIVARPPSATYQMKKFARATGVWWRGWGRWFWYLAR